MFDNDHSSLTGWRIVLRPLPFSRSHRAPCPGIVARHDELRVWFERRPVRSPTFFRIVGRLSGESLGIVRVGRVTDLDGEAAVAVGGAAASGPVASALIDAALISAGSALEEMRLERVELSLLGADRALRRRMRMLGLRPSALPWFRRGPFADEIVVRLSATELESARAKDAARSEHPSAWTFAPPHAFPA